MISKKVLLERINEGKTLKIIGSFIANGFLIINKNHIYKTRSFFDIIRYFNHIHLNLRIRKKDHLDDVCLKCGFSKQFVIVGNSYVYCFYKSKDSYMIQKKSYYEYYNLLALPKMNIIGFYDDAMVIKCEKIIGVEHTVDKDYLLVEKLLEYACQTKTIFDNKNYYYIQHGDLTYKNIIWKTNDNFVLIDLDNIGYKPILFDVIHLLATNKKNKTLDDVMFDLLKHQEKLKMVLDRFDYFLDDSTLDIIFYQFIKNVVSLLTAGFLKKHSEKYQLNNTYRLIDSL